MPIVGRKRPTSPRFHPWVFDNISLLNPFFDKYDSAYFGNTDDMIGVGVKALEDAAKAFDPKRRVRFSTYAWRWIDGAFGRNIPYKREKPTSSIDYDPRKGKSPSTYDDAVLRDDDDEVDSTQIADPSASKTISDRDYRSIVERVLGMAQMQGKMNQMLWMFYIDGYSLKEIANKMNIPREQTVGAYISTARSRIRKMLGKYDIHSKSELLSKLDRLNI